MTRSPTLRLSAFLALCLLLWSSDGVAQTAPAIENDPVYAADACINQMTDRLGEEQRIYRGILLGINDARDEAMGTTRYTDDGTAWIKTGPNAWETDTPTLIGSALTDTLSDSQINQRTERDPMTPWPPEPGKFERRGLLSAKQASASDIIPSLLQSYRALHCRLAAVCESVSLSFEGASEDILPIDSPGCATLLMAPLDRCNFKAADREVYRFVDRGSEAFVRTFCEPAAKQITDQEAEILKLSVTYRASYDSLLQFAGNLDYFLRLFNGNGLEPLREAMPLLGQLQRIPCFLSECNE